MPCTSVADASSPPLPIGYDDPQHSTRATPGRTPGITPAASSASAKWAGGGTSVAARYLYGADGLRVKKWVRRSDTAALDVATVSIANLTEQTRWAESGGGANTVLHVLDGTSRVAQTRSGPLAPTTRARRRCTSSLTIWEARPWPSMPLEHGSTVRSTSPSARRASAASHQRYRFTGMKRDAESGLAYHAARYYPRRSPAGSHAIQLGSSTHAAPTHTSQTTRWSSATPRAPRANQPRHHR